MSLQEKDDIANEVIDKFKEVQEKKVLGDYRSPTVHVSHLTQPCIRRSWYDFHEPSKKPDYSSICNFFFSMSEWWSFNSLQLCSSLTLVFR